MKRLALTMVCMILTTALFAQGKEFTGKVVIKDVGIGITEAKITAKKGAREKTVTNHEGVFYIQNVDEDFTIDITHPQYIRITKRVSLSDGYEQVFELELDKTEDATYKDGYGSSKNTDTQGGVTISDTQSATMTYDQVLAQLRRIPGVTVSGDQILVRGPSSINSSNAPTVIVDGILSQEGLSGVDPTSIVKIEVLKGSAASMYGARGATGVIVITTRYK